MTPTDLLKAAERVQKLARQHDARRQREAGVPRAEVAKRVGVSPSTVTRWTRES